MPNICEGNIRIKFINTNAKQEFIRNYIHNTGNGDSLDFEDFVPSPENLSETDINEWRSRFWGVKWNPATLEVIDVTDDILELSFTTPWSHCCPALIGMLKKIYNDVETFAYLYGEPGENLGGELYWEPLGNPDENIEDNLSKEDFDYDEYTSRMGLENYFEDDEIEYDRRAVEVEYELEEGELDGVSIREAENIVGEEEGALDRFLSDNEDTDDDDEEEEEYEADERYFPYISNDEISSSYGHREIEDAIEYAEDNNLPLVKVHRYYIKDGKHYPAGDPETVWTNDKCKNNN